MHYDYQSEETLSTIHQWQIDSKLEYYQDNACLLKIYSGIPGVRCV